MNTKIIIFGCGKLGHEALNVLGSENVECFCDNNPTLIGSEQYGKRVISFDELKEKHSDTGVIICANVRFGNAWAMAQQCEENGVKDYIFWQTVRGKDIFQKEAQLLSYLDSSVNRKQLKSEVYIQRGEELQEQLKYLRRHIDIRHIKPATGSLREWQLMMVKTSAELFEALSELQIKPILYSGNLLGYVRHNGFIPWDDDIDFALMRNEYERLRDFCRQHMYTEEEYIHQEVSVKKVREELKDFYYRESSGDVFKICRRLSDGSRAEVDFFVMDYYADNYSLEELLEQRKDIAAAHGETVFDNEEKQKFFRQLVEKNRGKIVEESEQIYFGVDNLDLMNKFHRGGWIPRNVVFPMKKIQYEGACFYVPNDAEEFVKFEYEHIWELPDDAGLQQHTWRVKDGVVYGEE